MPPVTHTGGMEIRKWSWWVIRWYPGEWREQGEEMRCYQLESTHACTSVESWCQRQGWSFL